MPEMTAPPQFRCPLTKTGKSCTPSAPICTTCPAKAHLQEPPEPAARLCPHHGLEPDLWCVLCAAVGVN